MNKQPMNLNRLMEKINHNVTNINPITYTDALNNGLSLEQVNDWSDGRYAEWQAMMAKQDSEKLQREALNHLAEKSMAECDVDISDAKFENFVAQTKAQQDFLNDLGNYANAMLSGELANTQNLVLCGQYGAGKTFGAGCIINHVSRNADNRIVFVAKQWDRIVDMIYKSNRKYSPTRQDDNVFGILAEADILFIDEVGSAETSLDEHQRKLIGGLIRQRNNKRKYTIIATNHTEETIIDAMGEFGFEGLRDSLYAILSLPFDPSTNRRKQPTVFRY